MLTNLDEKDLKYIIGEYLKSSLKMEIDRSGSVIDISLCLVDEYGQKQYLDRQSFYIPRYSNRDD